MFHLEKEDELLRQFTAYFHQYENTLYNFALKTIRSELLARDIVQEVFIKLWSIRQQFPEINNIEDYLYRMVRNKVMDVLRQLANDRKLRTDYFNGRTWEETSAFDILTLKEQDVALAVAISELPPQRRLIYQLSQLEGHSRNEIAEQLGISPSTVKNQLTAALSHLRKIISGGLRFF